MMRPNGQMNGYGQPGGGPPRPGMVPGMAPGPPTSQMGQMNLGPGTGLKLTKFFLLSVSY